MRFEKVRKLLEQLKDQKSEVLDSDETLTESEIALGQLVLPLFRDREQMSRELTDLTRRAATLQLAVNHIPLPTLVLEPTGELLIVNQAARELFGGPAVPAPVLEEARRFVLRPVHRERSAEASLDGKTKLQLRLILGKLREQWDPRSPQLVFVVKRGTTLPMPRERLVERRGFTAKEAEVAELVAQGLTNQEIADTLGVSIETVRTHLTAAFAKSGAKNRAELVTLAVAAAFGLEPEER